MAVSVLDCVYKFLVNFVLILFLMMLSQSCSAMGARPPQYNCEVILWEMDGQPCLIRKGELDFIIVCPGDEDYAKDYAAVSLSNFDCLIQYRDLLIKDCKKWR
jgi:hypothetical protein